ncbi:soma ferritin-like isoform X4 [Panulirus ornatus]|uniref:soma ferritin-like isoform X4 n=1 Tax=Panulirus ornatus TaxID=150431 RepID=UPI003A893BD3
MGTSLLHFALLMGLLVVLPCSASSRKEFRNDMPSNPDDEGETHHHDFGGILPVSRCRHNYNERTEAGINRQINLMMYVGYVYHSMAQHFGRCDVALPGFQKFFRQMAQDQREKAETLMNYQNLRGGLVRLQQVTAPSTAEWGSGIEAMEHALELEKTINEVEKIFTISQYITNLERVGPGLGEYMFDKLPQN